MEPTNLHDLLEEAIQDLYSAEDQLVEALPLMATKAQDAKLKKAFNTHLNQTEEQRNRLTQIAEMLDIDADGETCKAMKGLIKEAQSFIDEDANAPVMDAGLINMAQKVEHYEIASYGTAHRWALQCGEDSVAELLAKSLEEEKQTDELLTTIAEAGVNRKAEVA